MDIKHFTNSQIKTLEMLATYRYLTGQQMMKLGVCKNKHTLSRLLAPLAREKKAYIKVFSFGVQVGVGRLPFLYCLTPRGARLLAEYWQCDPKEIRNPKGVKIFSRDYHHRVATIDFEIELKQFAEIHELNVSLFNTYFDVTGANNHPDPDVRRLSKNRIPIGDIYFIPDAIIKIDGANKSWVFTLEVHNGFDTKRLQRQLEKHLLALNQGTVSTFLNYPYAHRILSILEDRKALKAVLNRICADVAFQEALPFFAFSTLEDIRENFVKNWWFADGVERPLVSF